jgi:2-octaprenyl-6-methoxyphenol hydroxylase
MFIVKIKNNMKVCIIGNGLSALTLAKGLVNQNIHVDLLIDKKNLNINQYRTIGISKSNSDYFNENIMDIEKHLWKLKKIEIYSDNLTKEKLIYFENNHDRLFSIVKNYKLYQILEKDLSQSKYFKKKLISNRNLFFINNYKLVINCSYTHQITKKYFNKKILKKYNSLAYTSIIKHKKILNDVAIQIFTKNGPLAFLPISDYETSVVYSIQNSFNKKNYDIKDLIKSYNLKYKINKIEKIYNFELNSLSLRSYYHNNILAFGDLLHKIHPLAGQGFNMTIRDIKILISIIKKKIDLGLPLDCSINEEFENIMKHKNFIFSNGIDLIHEFFNIQRKTKSKILNKSIQFIGKSPSINKFFTKIADKGTLF